MNNENRVLNRTGARDLTLAEAEVVVGSVRIHTETVCTVAGAAGYFDGDIGECGGY